VRRDGVATGERVYAAVKRELLSGALAPGERVDAAWMAERHAASITPVRAALHRLVGEGLVVTEAGEGFHTPRVSEASLRDLYTWNSRCLQLASQLAAAPSNPVMPHVTTDPGDFDVITETETLFAAVAARSGNEQCQATIAAMNDKLHVARTQETGLFADVREEWSNLAATLSEGQSGPINTALAAYHRRRIRAASELVRLMHRRGPAA
jgi:DNA-binding FadR family transcriptional regulator